MITIYIIYCKYKEDYYVCCSTDFYINTDGTLENHAKIMRRPIIVFIINLEQKELFYLLSSPFESTFIKSME